MFSLGNGRGNPRLPSGFTQTVAKSALRALSKRLALFSRINTLFPIPRALAPFYSVAPDVWLARGACGAATHTPFSYQPVARRPESFDDTRLDERIFELSLPVWRKTCLRSDHNVRKPARRENV